MSFSGKFPKPSPCFSAEVKEITFKSACLNKDKIMTVILPDAYAKEAERRFPAAYFLDGFAGGHGAMFVGLRHPDVFGVVASMSGGLDIRPFANKWNIKKWLGDKAQHPENWEKHTVINQLEEAKDTKQKILFDCGTKDFFLKVNRDVDKKMTELGIKHKYEEFPGGHSWGYWKVAVSRHMAFFAEAFGKKH